MNIKNYKNLFKTLLGFCMIVCFLIGNSINALGQPPPGITISWDKEVGCQVYRFEDGEIPLFLENIESSDCIRVCENSEVTYTLDNVPSSATISWDIIGGTTSNNTSSSCTINWGGVGTASITFTVTNGNAVETKVICIEEVDLEKSIITSFEDMLQIYPNPAKDFATVKYEINSENALLEVYDLLGRSLYKQNLTSTRGELRLDISSFVSGVYIVVIKQEDGMLLQQKLIIE